MARRKGSGNGDARDKYQQPTKAHYIDQDANAPACAPTHRSVTETDTLSWGDVNCLNCHRLRPLLRELELRRRLRRSGALIELERSYRP